MSIGPHIPDVQVFQILTWKMVKVIGQGYSWSSTHFNASAIHFTSIIPTIPQMWPMECLTMKKTQNQYFEKQICQKKKNEFPTQLISS